MINNLQIKAPFFMSKTKESSDIEHETANGKQDEQVKPSTVDGSVSCNNWKDGIESLEAAVKILSGEHIA